MEIEKLYLTAANLLHDSYVLAEKLVPFAPNFLVALWRGGTPVGMAVQEYLDYRGIHSDHIAIRTSAYAGIDVMHGEIRVHGLEYIADRLEPEHRLVIVDDVFDTGLTIQAVLKRIRHRCTTNMPPAANVRIATVYYKPSRNKTTLIPHDYVHETDKWLVFPHELTGLTFEEIVANKEPEIAAFFRKNSHATPARKNTKKESHLRAGSTTATR